MDSPNYPQQERQRLLHLQQIMLQWSSDTYPASLGAAEERFFQPPPSLIPPSNDLSQDDPNVRTLIVHGVYIHAQNCVIHFSFY